MNICSFFKKSCITVYILISISVIGFAQITVSHSSSMSILPDNTVACIDNASYSLNNMYARTFDISSFSITHNFVIDSIAIGIQEMYSGLPQGFPLEILFSTITNGYPYGSLQELATYTVFIPDTSLAVLTFPVSVIVPADSVLVVELVFQKSTIVPTYFFIGSNDEGETESAYLYAPECGVDSPTSLADLGFSTINIVLALYGYECETTYNTISVTECEEYTSPSGLYTWTQSGVYTDVIPNAMGCDSVITIDLYIVGLQSTIVQVDNYLVSVQDNADYEWIDCASLEPIPHANKQLFKANAPGEYALRLHKLGCELQTDCIVISSIPTNIEIPKPDAAISVYPNPSSDYIIIDANNLAEEVSYMLITNTGVVLQAGIFSGSLHLSLDEYAAGVYTIIVSSQSIQEAYRFSKQ